MSARYEGSLRQSDKLALTSSLAQVDRERWAAERASAAYERDAQSIGEDED